MFKTFTPEIQKQSFWSLSQSETVNLLKTDIQNGLSEKEAEERLKIFGLNIIENIKSISPFIIFLNQFKSPLILILIFAGIVTLFINHLHDALFIFAAVIVNTTLGFYQEHKAEKALAELKTYLKQRSRVIRGGIDHEIDAANLVPGDIIRLAQGDRVPADGRILFLNDFQIDEALLTGESLPITKIIEPVKAEAVLGDQSSMVFAGTLVTQGICTAVVCRTDFFTEIGKIASLISDSQREETPLQKAIRQFSTKMGILLGLLTLMIFIIGIILKHSPAEMFLTSVAIAVSAVPEGLPIAMTVILAVGVERMAKRKGVIRKLVAAETLGSTTIILTDKTGTLTMAKMMLSKILPYQNIEELLLLKLALLNTNVLIENQTDPVEEWRTNGRTIEVALVKSAALREIYVNEIKEKQTIINSLPFNAINKFSVSLIKENEQHKLIFLGAPDILINHSTLNETERKEILEKINSLAESGELVLGVAVKENNVTEDFSFSNNPDYNNLSFKGLLTLRDPIRPNVKDAIKKVGGAGIKTIIMTGDHRGTAMSIAREIGIEITNENVLDATELRLLSDVELKKQLPILRVISRVTPLDKMRVVKMFQEMGEIVAMTGDGVNDAPSIKQANIGIAMGSGTEVARDVADLVLLDDNFETIVAAVEEGHQIMNNLRKVLIYLLSNVMDALLLIGGSLLTGLALPLNALQILWVNFFSDSFPAVAFAFEKDAGGLVRHTKNGQVVLFDPLMKFLILFIGIFTSILLFVLYWFLLKIGVAEDLVRTFIFASFGTYTLFLTFSLKNLDKNIFQYSIFSNHYLLAGVGIGIFLMTIAIYVPFMQSLLDTVPLPFFWALGVILVGVFNIATIELGKILFRHK